MTHVDTPLRLMDNSINYRCLLYHMYSKFVFEPKTSIKPYLKAENQRVFFPFELILTLLEKVRARDWNSVLPAIALHGYETFNKKAF